MLQVPVKYEFHSIKYSIIIILYALGGILFYSLSPYQTTQFENLILNEVLL